MRNLKAKKNSLMESIKYFKSNSFTEKEIEKQLIDYSIEIARRQRLKCAIAIEDKEVLECPLVTDEINKDE